MRLASRGLRDLDQGRQQIRVPAELAAVRRQARRVMRRSSVTAALFTVLYLLMVSAVQ